jgi:IPT/TIG domain
VTNRTRTTIASLLLVPGLAGCSRSPSAPSTVPSVPSPSVQAVSPKIGSTGGGTILTIGGTGFQPGTIVTIDGIAPAWTSIQNKNGITVETVAHPAGVVDVVVTDPDGRADRLAGSYTYASPASFDFNGSWQGGAGSSVVDQHYYELEMRFTIANNLLVALWCGQSSFTFPAPVSVHEGEFSIAEGGIEASGRIVSASQAVGTINVAPCLAGYWTAAK